MSAALSPAASAAAMSHEFAGSASFEFVEGPRLAVLVRLATLTSSVATRNDFARMLLGLLRSRTLGHGVAVVLPA